MGPSSVVQLYTGRTMPVMGLGTWQLKHDTAEVVAYALQQGFRMVDTSGDYGTQPAIGKAIKKCGIPREELFIVTKIEETDNAYEAAKANVKEMGLGYADLILIHRPPRAGAGVPLWKGLIEARNERFTVDIGVSNYSINQIEELVEATGEVPVVNQIEWSPFGHSEDMLFFCQENEIIIQAYSSLTRGKRLNDPTLAELAARYGKTPAQILLRWGIQLGVVPIVKANTKAHIDENLDIFDFELSPDDMATLNGLNHGYSTFGTLPYM